jgi:hypothetical protein
MPSSTLPSTRTGPATTTQSLSQDFSSIARAALARTEEGQRVFYPIAALWDSYLQSEDVRKLPAHLRKPLARLCKEVASIAHEHFEAYIKGIQTRPTKSSTVAPIPPAPAPSTTASTPPAAVCPATSYASITAASPPPRPPQARKQQTTTEKAPKARPDTRLFLRLGPNHPAREAGSFALLTALKSTLGAHAHLLKEALEVPSGFALCTDSLEALTALEKHSDLIAATVEDCQVERQHPWITYRIDNIPRTVRLLDPLHQLQNRLVTDQILREAVLDFCGQFPVRATETRSSSEQGLFNTSWSLHFLADAHKALPRSLRILGTTAHAHPVTRKQKTVQCIRCYQWHNSRSCLRPQRCRICGSSKHIEELHPPSCAATPPHQCPAKCLHCGGPHPSDELSCPLRPVPLHPKTGPQKDALLRAGKAARSRAVADAKCCKTAVTDTVMGNQSSPPPETPGTPKTPTRNRTQSPLQAPPTNLAPRFFAPESSNRFSTLNYDV